MPYARRFFVLLLTFCALRFTLSCMPETLGYFAAADGTPLYGVLHAPEAPARAPVVIAPGFFEERKSAYAALTGLARELAAAGHPVLRFDYRGSGESGGDAGTRRWNDLATDLAAARDALARASGVNSGGGVVLLGLRMGGTLALQAAARLDARAVVALAPVVQGSSQARLWRLRSKIRAELTAGTAAPAAASAQRGEILDFDGLPVAAAFFEDVASVDLLREQAAHGPALILQLSHREDLHPETVQLAKRWGPACRAEALRIEPFWDRLEKVETRPVVERTLNFLAAL